MATRYQVRAVVRNFSSPATPLQLRFKCWRLRLYVTRAGANVEMDGVPIGVGLSLAGTSVLEFGGVMLDGAPVMFSQMFTFTTGAPAKNTLVIVEEYLDPLP